MFEGRTDVWLSSSYSTTLLTIPGEIGASERKRRLRYVEHQSVSLSTLTPASGWNAAFEYEGKTYAELPLEEKIRVGARGKALRKFLDWLADQPPVYEP